MGVDWAVFIVTYFCVIGSIFFFIYGSSEGLLCVGGQDNSIRGCSLDR